LVHPGNPNLTPVEVTPILPSREFWGQQFLHGAFDNDPTSSLKLLEKQSVGTRRNYLAQGMLTQRRDEGATVAEFSLFLPQKATYEQRRAVQSGEADDIAVGEVCP
jgi:lactam utilization protein B